MSTQRRAIALNDEDMSRIEKLKQTLAARYGTQTVSSIVRMALIALESREV